MSIKSEEYPNLDNLCRLCLLENKQLISIFNKSESSSRHLSVPMRIMACASLEVEIDDELPKCICEDCRYQLEKSFYFRNLAQLSNTKLRKHIRLLTAGKHSTVFEKKLDDDDDDHLQLEDSFQFIAAAEAVRNKVVEERIEKIEETHKKELDELKSNFELQMQTVLKDTDMKLKKSMEKSQELKTELKQKIRNSEIKNLLDDVENYIQQKRVELLTCKNNEKISINGHKTSKRAINTKEESYEIVENFMQNEREDFSADSSNVEENKEEEHTPTEIIIYEENVAEGTDEEILIDTESNDYADDASERTALYQIETQDSMETVKNNDDVLYFKMNNNTQSEEDMEMMEFIDMQVEPVQKVQSKSTTAFVKQTTDKEDSSPKFSGYTKVINCGRLTDTPKTFKCDLCVMSFSTINILNRHYRVHERSKKKGITYQCHECQLIFSCKSALNRHALLHTGERPFKCDICGKSFVQREILKRHLQVHSGERPYQCPHCGRTYTQKVNLQQHINHNHSSKPKLPNHLCHLCPKRFNHASGLSRHLTTHSGVSYQCIECERCFGDRSSVKRHVMNVHSAEGANSDSADKYIKETIKEICKQTVLKTKTEDDVC